MTIQVPAGAAARSNLQQALPQLQGPSAPRLPAGIRFEGEATFPCNLAIEGEFKGSLTLSNSSVLLVSHGGVVDGAVRAQDARVEGTVLGELDCSNGSVEFESTSQCTARVLYRDLSIARGAQVEAELQRVGRARG